MLGTLMESRGTPERRIVSSLASFAFHGAIITAAVIATSNPVALVTAPPLEVHVVHFARPIDPPPPRPREAPIVSASLAPIGFLPRFQAPLVVPSAIPSVDLSVAPAAVDFVAGPVGQGIRCAPDDCPGHAIGAGDRTLWTSSDIMMQLKDKPVPPRYPESLRRAGVEGEVIVRFTVDTTGRIDMATVETLSSTHDAFTASVRETLVRMRFTPSMVGHRKVTAVAIMPFRFTLR